MDGLEKFRQFFPEYSPTFGKRIVNSQAELDGQYVAGQLDYFLRARGLSPEDFGVSKDAITYRKEMDAYTRGEKEVQDIRIFRVPELK